MKKIAFLFTLILGISFSVSAQEQKTTLLKKNTIYATFGNNYQTYYMIHYDRILYTKNMWKVAANVGTAYFSEAGSNKSLSFSGGGSLLFGKKHHAELSLGYRYTDVSSGTVFNSNEILSSLGYRFQKDNGGFFGTFRLGLSAGSTKTTLENLPSQTTERVRPFMQIGLGFTF